MTSYKLFTNEKKVISRLIRASHIVSLLVILCAGIISGILGSAMAQAVPGNNCKQYVYDTRTYGIRYHRGWFDSLLSFSTLPDTVQGDTCGAPSLFSLGSGQLWWYDGSRNYQLFPSGGGGVTALANGLETQGSTGIIGYATTTPSQYRAVNIKTGNEFYNINADSLYASAGHDSIAGAYQLVGPTTPYDVGPGIRIGYKNPSGVDNNEELDSLGPGWSMQFANGNFGSLFMGDTLFTLQLQEVGGNNYNFNMAWQPTNGLTPTVPESFQTTWSGGGYWRTTTDGAGLFNPVEMHLDSGLRVKTTPDGTNFGNFFWVSSEEVTHVCRLAVDGDDSLSIPGSITAIINNALGVPAGPTGYTITGHDQGFIITFTTGAISSGTDSTTSVIRISWRQPAHGNYIVTPVAYNSTAAIALSTMQPYIKNIDNLTWELHGALNNWSTAGFAASTTYSFAFKTVDIGQ